MKLAHLSTRFPPAPGGVERHVGELAPRLVARGYEVDVYTSDLNREYPMERLPSSVPREEVRAGVRVHRLPVRSLPWELHYPFFRGLERSLRRDRPRLLHVHTYGTNQASVARHFFRKTQIPYVVTAHYHPIWSIYGGWLRHRIRGFYDRYLAAPIIADAARLIVQSAEEERLIRENGYPLPRVERIPPGYSPLPAPPPGPRPFRDAWKIPGPFILFVGRLASNKGLPSLVEAFADLAQGDPSSSLVLVGADGGMRAGVETRVSALGLKGRVFLPGFISDESMLAAAFREARLFVLPSEYEAFGLVLLEALAQGTPIVASRVGGIPEFIEDGKSGLLVPPEDRAALIAAFGRLWEDEALRQQLGEYGRDQTVPRFSWERVVDRLVNVYREVAGD